jgi:hypothetical protein
MHPESAGVNPATTAATHQSSSGSRCRPLSFSLIRKRKFCPTDMEGRVRNESRWGHRHRAEQAIPEARSQFRRQESRDDQKTLFGQRAERRSGLDLRAEPSIGGGGTCSTRNVRPWGPLTTTLSIYGSPQPKRTRRSSPTQGQRSKGLRSPQQRSMAGDQVTLLRGGQSFRR